MSDKLQDFVNKHKKELDTEEPSKELWKKIDSKLGANSGNTKSKWISNLKYFGFGASVLLATIYFISQKMNEPSSVALDENIKDSALNSSGIWVKSNQNVREESNKDHEKKSSDSKRESESMDASAKDLYEGTTSIANHNIIENIDTANTNTPEDNSDNKIKNEEIVSVKEEKTIVSAISTKRKKINIPEAPVEINTYSGTLYDESSLCSVVQAYKFTGKVNMDDEANFQGHRTLKTVPCSKLENVKAVWIKGKTSGKLTLTLNEGFKNIVLQKSDGRKISPVAISHYYTGLGVISGYSGRHFDMIFKEKVELVIFFKDAEAGDKVIIDDAIEAVVK